MATQTSELEPTRSSGLQPVLYGLIAVALAFGWQAIAVRVNYDGSWTALYETGTRFKVPAALEHENIYRLPNEGYDGQFYHYIAHDPLFRRSFADSIDAPRVRYRRILMPGLAFLLAAGQQQEIDRAYELVMLVFVLLGVYWTAACFARAGHNPAWGVAFLLVPATLVSLTRMTIDVSLVALSAGFALYATEPPSWPVFVIVMLAPFSRETGIVLPIAYCLYSLLSRRVATSAAAAGAMLPCLGWWVFVHRHTKPDINGWISWPFHPLLNRLIAPSSYPNIARFVSEYAALAGIILGFGICIWLATRMMIDPIAIACCGFFFIGMLLGTNEAWVETTGFGRTFSPLLVLLPLWGVPRRIWLTLTPLTLTVPWAALDFGLPTLHIIHRIASKP